ncbi:hypothetical protein NIES2107_49840 [Nostoc carneum NIES-2107]|nr:hypothetical protein NIES2107_49840 [Nostoc carneum NIES-2107]
MKRVKGIAISLKTEYNCKINNICWKIVPYHQNSATYLFTVNLAFLTLHNVSKGDKTKYLIFSYKILFFSSLIENIYQYVFKTH